MSKYLIKDVWEDVNNLENVKRILVEHVSDELADAIDQLGSDVEDKYEKLECKYEELECNYCCLQDDFDSLECEYSDLEHERDKLKVQIDHIKELLQNPDLCNADVGQLVRQMYYPKED